MKTSERSQTVRFIKRVNPDAPPYVPFKPRKPSPGRKQKPLYRRPGIDWDRCHLPFTDRELMALTASLGMSESELRQRLKEGRIPNIESGGFTHPLYKRWTNLRLREKAVYGAVCLRWLISFRFFCIDVGRPVTNDARLCRINKNKGWEPGNVRWL